jgi:hypothetical protein
MDECHTILIQRNFRPVMRQLTSMIRFVKVQLGLLTATLSFDIWEATINPEV